MTLVEFGTGGQPITGDTSDLRTLYLWVRDGGRAFTRFVHVAGTDPIGDGYEIRDGLGRWLTYGASCVTLSPDHAQNVEWRDGALYFDGFFRPEMVAEGSALGPVENGVVRVRMRIREEAFDNASLTLGRVAGLHFDPWGDAPRGVSR